MHMRLQVAEAPPADQPWALAVEAAHGPVIHAANPAARQAGVGLAARVSDMRALCPALQVDLVDPQEDHTALQGLALWARRWCPWTAADDWRADGERGRQDGALAYGLILDSTGSDHLRGGEAALLAGIEADLAGLGLSARLALAPTWGAAWALARFGPARSICGDTGPLPVAGLRLDAEILLLLNRLGIRRIAQLADLSRLSLARRFPRGRPAQNPLIRLDQLSGHLPEPVSPPDAPSVFRALARLAEPILDPGAHLPGLCAALAGQLAGADHGARRLCLAVYRTDGGVSRIEAACSLPSRDAGHLAFLFRDRLERLDPGYGFDLITLEATVTEPLGASQTDLAGNRDTGLEIAHLVDRLTARFGRAALAQLLPVASHIPERAETMAMAGGGAAAGRRIPGSLAPDLPSADVPLSMSERPHRLLARPEELHVESAAADGPPVQFQWRRRGYRVARCQGPERIAPEWWQDRPGTRLRDYFKVEDALGHRFWIYREGLHDDGRGGVPRWFLHGIFA